MDDERGMEVEALRRELKRLLEPVSEILATQVATMLNLDVDDFIAGIKWREAIMTNSCGSKNEYFPAKSS